MSSWELFNLSLFKVWILDKVIMLRNGAGLCAMTPSQYIIKICLITWKENMTRDLYTKLLYMIKSRLKAEFGQVSALLVQLKNLTAIHVKINDIILFLNCAFLFIPFSMGKK